MVYMYLFHLPMPVISHLPAKFPLIASLDYKSLKLSPVSFPYYLPVFPHWVWWLSLDPRYLILSLPSEEGLLAWQLLLTCLPASTVPPLFLPKRKIHFKSTPLPIPTSLDHRRCICLKSPSTYLCISDVIFVSPTPPQRERLVLTLPRSLWVPTVKTFSQVWAR